MNASPLNLVTSPFSDSNASAIFSSDSNPYRSWSGFAVCSPMPSGMIPPSPATAGRLTHRESDYTTSTS